MQFGSGNQTFEVVDNWAKRPKMWPFVEVADVDVDKDDNVYVFSRGPRPVMIFDKDGNFLDWWGDSQFTNPHGITVAPDGNVWCVDTRDHTVKRFTKEGKLLLTLGTRHFHAVKMGGEPFNQPTHVAIASTGNIYISDGYGNARVHVFSPEGKLLFGWGEPGTGPGQFVLVHNVAIDERDRVYVCDRGNNRVQVFNLEGQFITEWPGLHHPTALIFGPNHLAYVAELDHRLSIWDRETGKKITGWGDEGESREAGLFISPHGTTVDSRGVIYVGEVAETTRGVDRGFRAVQKFVPVI